MMQFLQHYERSSVQKMNMAKSNAYVSKHANAGLIANLTGLEVKELPFYYLGAPI